MLPRKIDRKSHRENDGKRCPAHRSFVRKHACCACGSEVAIECAHVRVGTGGGIGVKPSDRWCISLCKTCHNTQHLLGEPEFEKRHNIDMRKLAGEFAKASPHWPRLRDMA